MSVELFLRQYKLLIDLNHTWDKSDEIFIEDALKQKILPCNITHRHLADIIRTRINNTQDEKTRIMLDAYDFKLILVSAENGDPEARSVVGNYLLFRASQLPHPQNDTELQQKNFLFAKGQSFLNNPESQLDKNSESNRRVLNLEKNVGTEERVSTQPENRSKRKRSSNETDDESNSPPSQYIRTEPSNISTTTTTSSQTVINPFYESRDEEHIETIHLKIRTYNEMSAPTTAELCNLVGLFLNENYITNDEKEFLIRTFLGNITEVPEAKRLITKYYLPNSNLYENISEQSVLPIPNLDKTSKIYTYAENWGDRAANSNLNNEQRLRAGEEAMYYFEQLARKRRNPYAMMQMAIINQRIPHDINPYHEAGFRWSIRAASYNLLEPLTIFKKLGMSKELNLIDTPLYNIVEKYISVKFPKRTIF